VFAIAATLALVTACGQTQAVQEPSMTQSTETDVRAEVTPTDTKQIEDAASGDEAAEPEVAWPAPRIHPTMFFDPAKERILMFSGMSAMQRKIDLNEVWAFDADGGEWQFVGEMEPKDALIAFGFDEESGQIVSFNNMPRSTWSYDLATGRWEEKQPAQQPTEDPLLGRRFGPLMTYDAESDRLIFFGGGAPEKLYSDTWAYDFNNDQWEEMQPDNSPSPRAMGHMAYDAESDRVILWGGFMEEGVEDVRVWAYDYNADSWESMENNGGPQVHWERGGMVYIPDQDRFLLFTGMREHEDVLVGPETWYYNYDENSWSKIEAGTSPPQMAMYSMVFDPSIGKVVLFGGERSSKYAGNITDEVWLFDPQSESWSQMANPAAGQE
jgi:N-acetylneuraminic acid mutarotase